jgi:hypothetical protein
MDRHTFPNGGWQFLVPQTMWQPPTPKSSTFDQTVVLIIKHRLANPAIVAKHSLATDFNSVANELETYNMRRLGIPEPPKPSPQRFNLGQAVAAVSGGVRTLADWLGGGGVPVSQELADKRALTCSDCPQNGKGDWLSTFTIPAQNLIRRQLQERKDLKLTTPYDDKIQMCEACACPLHLKVHVPIVYVNQRIPPAIREKLDKRCWILHESA